MYINATPRVRSGFGGDFVDFFSFSCISIQHPCLSPCFYMLFDRNLLVSSRKEVRADLALKYAKQELAGETGLGSVILPETIATPRQETSGLEEIFSMQARGHSPIIIVPSSSSSKSRITALNVVRFLVDGVYEEPSIKSVSRPVMPLEVVRSLGGHSVTFRVFDDVSRFRKEDWKCVVGVFSDGKMWQFTGWPFRNESDLFQTVLVFNLRFSDEPAAMASSRIRSLLVKRGTRHQDAAVMIEFWKALESFIVSPRVKKFSSTAKLP